MSGTRVLTVERSTSTAHRLSRYDGVCGDLHGHNMRWEAEVTVDMSGTGDDNMPLDLKDISELIDAVDHAVVLDRDDELVRGVIELVDAYDHEMIDSLEQDGPFVTEFEDFAYLGQTFLFDGDPTCEVLSQWMADRIRQIDHVVNVDLTVYETDKYGIRAVSGHPQI